MPNLRAAAFFDLDHTLLARNSGALYAREAYRSGRLSAWDSFRGLYWVGMHRLGWLDVVLAYQRAGALFRGCVAETLREEVDVWFAREVRHLLRPGAREVLARHRARAEPLVLVTNSSAYIAAAAVRYWQLDVFLANDILEDANGRITGAVSQPLCYGLGKVHKASAWAAQHGVSLAASYFYSDSFSDLPLLQCVRFPEVVHPDRPLRRLAQRLGWRIHDWSRA